MSVSLYGRRWRKRRAQQLAEHPLCRLCMDIRGAVVVATVADHVKPHRGDPVLFEGPLQSLCAPCHNSVKQSLEKGGDGYIKGCDLRGYPIDPRHPWNNSPGGGAFNLPISSNVHRPMPSESKTLTKKRGGKNG